jgi:hypothetical protein
MLVLDLMNSIYTKFKVFASLTSRIGLIVLIEPVDKSGTWQEFLCTHGEGVHFFACEIKGPDEK